MRSKFTQVQLQMQTFINQFQAQKSYRNQNAMIPHKPKKILIVIGFQQNEKKINLDANQKNTNQGCSIFIYLFIYNFVLGEFFQDNLAKTVKHLKILSFQPASHNIKYLIFQQIQYYVYSIGKIL
eukprot:TRINITY_DN2527_c0_g4_i2.p3 TRINITY_DN2527_c0_g4~~TRINITY_DN2527_c0_g4_i2.p3  ORF type:complete len:125 (-),score=0.57 TRINITY_DN2527_c0_g4_i2:370-744(-)